MTIFKQKADIAPISIISLLFAIDILMYTIGISWYILAIYCLYSIVSKGYIAAWNHHHQHVETFSIPFFNRLLEVMYWIQTGAVWYGWVLHHNLGHHAHYQDQDKDESAWKSPEGKKYSVFMYTWMITATAYYRMWNVGKKHKKIQKYFLIMCLIQLLILSALIIIQPLQAIFIFVIPMIASLTLTAYATYDHHSGLESEDPYKSSYNTLNPLYNKVTGNLGYHTAHHLKWWMHWSKLPEFHKTIEHNIDKKYYRNYKIMWHS